VYRDDAAALEERGAALEEQLAPLRVSGPPGAVVRVEELRRQLREVRRFGWAYAWLALLLPLAFVRVPSSAYLAPAALSVASLWFELVRQRRALAARSAVVAPAPVTGASSSTTDLPSLLAHQDALARELALYRVSGTRAEALAAEIPREHQELARHGRPFLWLGGALLLFLMPVTREDPLDPLPIAIGALALVLAGFAGRIWAHARGLADRLDVARREVARAERGAGVAASALPEQELAVRRARDEVERRGDGINDATQRVARAGVFGFAALLGVVAQLHASGGAMATGGAAIFVGLLAMFGVVTVGYGVVNGVRLARSKRALRIATLEEDTEEERLRVLRQAAAPHVRIAADAADVHEEARAELDCVDDSLSPPARYTDAGELP
jgi:hypothetical protein